MKIEEHRPDFPLHEVMGRVRIKVGDKIRIKTLSDKDTIVGSKIATVVQVYPRFVVLDFGEYKESRSVMDIYFNQRGLYERL